ncbi:MAG TPA: GntR family transcriptional regulator [Bryobacteraceae bacterium]|nr:GntR family transcriptional regulator [Bryobacteraceae bacterium]
MATKRDGKEAVFEKLESYTLRGRIAEQLRHAILNGTLQEGQRLVERKLASEFGASLTAVREALIELETEGFVVKRTNSATVVVKLSPEETEKIFEVRRLLESYVFEQAARLVSSEQLAKLEQAYNRLLEAAQRGDGKAFVQLDFEWHSMIWNIVGNEYLSASLRRTVVPLFALSAVHVASRPQVNLIQDASSHRPLLEALRKHDPEGARKAFAEALNDWKSTTSSYIFGRKSSPA